MRDRAAHLFALTVESWRVKPLGRSTRPCAVCDGGAILELLVVGGVFALCGSCFVAKSKTTSSPGLGSAYLPRECHPVCEVTGESTTGPGADLVLVCPHPRCPLRD